MCGPAGALQCLCAWHLCCWLLRTLGQSVASSGEKRSSVLAASLMTRQQQQQQQQQCQQRACPLKRLTYRFCWYIHATL